MFGTELLAYILFLLEMHGFCYYSTAFSIYAIIHLSIDTNFVHCVTNLNMHYNCHRL